MPMASAETLIDEAFILSRLRALLPEADVEVPASSSPDEDEAQREASDGAMIEAGCAIWDLSTNPDIGHFMVAHELLPLLFRLVAEHGRRSGRLIEVSVGTLATLAPGLYSSQFALDFDDTLERLRSLCGPGPLQKHHVRASLWKHVTMHTLRGVQRVEHAHC